MSVIDGMPMRQTPVAFSFYDQNSYYSHVASRISECKGPDDIISISTMGYDPHDSRAGEVLMALEGASLSGAIVALAVDCFPLLDSSTGPFGSSTPAISNSKFRAVDNFPRNNGLSMTGFVHHPRGLWGSTYVGRSHIKTAVVNHEVYLGGMSLDATDRVDLMVGFEDRRTAWFLHELVRASLIKRNVAAHLQKKDIILPIDARSKLLVDAGVRGQSAILQEVIDIIDTAQEGLAYASEQLPTGKVGRRLVAASKRCGEVAIGSNHPSKHDRFTWAHHVLKSFKRNVYPSGFFTHELPPESTTLHTKAVANENRGMVTSHNLNGIGVLLGTAEIGLSVRDKAFATSLREILKRQFEVGSTN